MPIYFIAIKATASASRVVITNSANFVKPVGSKIDLACLSRTDIQIADREVLLVQDVKAGAQSSTTLTLCVETTDPTLIVDLSHGGNGSIGISSKGGSVLNDQISGATQSFVLPLT